MTSGQPGHRDNVPSARELLTRQTSVEVLHWEALRDRRLAGLTFRRQHPAGLFVVDFCCPDCRLAIELEGAVHATQREHDAEREAHLAKAGYRILRFSNEAVHHRLASVLAEIRAVADSQPPRSTQPIPRTRAW